MSDVTHSQVDVEREFWCGITDSVIFINFSFDKRRLAFCMFLETAKDDQLLLSDIYPVWYTATKVIFLKQ